MNKSVKMWSSIGVAAIAILVVVLTGCKVEITTSSSGGKVVDARSSSLAGVAGASVTLSAKDNSTSLSTSTYTTGSDGSYTVDYADPGHYSLQASKSGWFFIPQDVYIGGWLQALPDTLGIALESSTALVSADKEVAIVLVWNSSYQDVDGHLTFPKGDGNGSAATTLTYNTVVPFDTPYAAGPNDASGFAPDTTDTSFRFDLAASGDGKDSNNTVSDILQPGGSADTRAAIQLDRDDTNGSGPEVITIRTIPVWPDSEAYGTSPTTGNHLPTTGPNGGNMMYGWTGVMEYYIDGWNGTNSSAKNHDSSDTGNLLSKTDGSGADAIAYVIQGSNLLGEFRVPAFANIRTAQMIRINFFIAEEGSSTGYTLMQIVPDIESVDYSTGIRSASGGPQVLNVFMGPRNAE